MKIKKRNKINPSFPLEYECWQCKSVLDVMEEDLRVRETLGERQFCGVDCPVCGVVGPAPVSDAYEAKFVSDRDWASNFLGFVFTLGGLLR